MVAGTRIADIVQVTLNLVLFDGLRTKRVGHELASYVRTVVLSLINYLELLVCFGLVYGVWLSLLDRGNDWTDAFYFSVISQTSIGYGDIAPVRWGKVIAVSQGVIAIFFTLLVLARVIALLPRPTSVLEDHARKKASHQ